MSGHSAAHWRAVDGRRRAGDSRRIRYRQGRYDPSPSRSRDRRKIAAAQAQGRYNPAMAYNVEQPQLGLGFTSDPVEQPVEQPFGLPALSSGPHEDQLGLGFASDPFGLPALSSGPHEDQLGMLFDELSGRGGHVEQPLFDRAAGEAWLDQHLPQGSGLQSWALGEHRLGF